MLKQTRFNTSSFGNSSVITRRRAFRSSIYFVSVLLLLSAFYLIHPPVHDDSSYAVTGTAVASDTTLSLSIDGGALSLDFTPTSQSGSFISTTTPAVVKVSTNNITGYTLGIESSDKDAVNADKLVNTDTTITTRNTIESITSSVSKSEYENNNKEGVELNNTWGYSPSYHNSIININTSETTESTDPTESTGTTDTTGNNPFYYPAPVLGDIINTTSSPNPVDNTIVDGNNEPVGVLEEDEYTINFGARLDYSIYSGTYTNPSTFIITAVGNPVPYSISYEENKPSTATTSDEVLNMPNAQIGAVQSGDTIAVVINTKVPEMKDITTTTPETPTYSGYVFNGWCTEQTTETLDQTTGKAYQSCPEEATIYQPGDSFGIDQTADNNTEILYAVWGAPAKVTFNANGLIYNNDTTDTINTVEYIPTYEGNKITGQKSNTIYTGAYNAPTYEETSPVTNIIMKGWSEDSTATTATYTNEQEITEELNLAAGNNIELYAVWNYATKITFNKNGADGTETMEPQLIEAGTTAPLEQNVYTNTGLVLDNWTTAADGTGDSYAPGGNYAATAGQSDDATLYAQWIEPLLYNYVKALVKKSGGNELTQSTTDLQAEITTPTTTDHTTDTSNSGVYKYDATTFGASSDATNTYNIYYYRGVLEPTADNGTYGSDGQATTYPNYVRLGNDTCWRIVRTTGSGGVKMIYNGVWNTTSNTCANTASNAQLANMQTFASKGASRYSSDWQKNIHYVGYTFNNKVTDSTTETSVDIVFGSDANPSLNNTRSNIKTYIEDNWYANNMASYTNLLESSAGYCNDRTTYSDNITTTVLSTITPYKTSDATMYFGAYGRNANTSAGKAPSLTCPRSTVDLYRYIQGSTGVSNELKYPAALLTADEASFAGSGAYTVSPGSSYNVKSYLRSGNRYWLFSPNSRISFGEANEFYLPANGYTNYSYIGGTHGVRPVISLNHEIIVDSGSGTATDPWVISE